MLAKDIKTRHIVNYNGAPCMIETINVQSPSARGAATFYKYRARNLITKQKVDITLRGGESLDRGRLPEAAGQVHVRRRRPHVHFLDQADYEPVLAAQRRPEPTRSKYLTEDLEGMQALIYNDECVGIQLPVAGGAEGRAVRSGHQGQLGHRRGPSPPRSKPA